MPDQSHTTVVGCLLDVSGSMREALESDRSDERASERLRAVLRAALKLAQAEQRRDRHALVFVGVFGLNTANDPLAVDLCGVIDALLERHDDRRTGHETGHELLTALANENNLAHVTEYIRTKLSDDEARIVYAYLRRHQNRIEEFVNAIPGAEQMQRVQTQSRAGAFGTGVLTGWLVGGPIGAAVGALIGGVVEVVAENEAVDRSEALQLARRMCDKWWLDFANFVPRRVNNVVDLLQRLEEQSVASNGDGEKPGTRSLVDTLRPYMYGNTPMREALIKSLAAFREHPTAEQRVLVVVSDGISTDGDPLPLACELGRENVIMATVYLTSDREIPGHRLYDQAAEGWSKGQRTLFDMAATVASATHPVPVLTSMGWEIPPSGECALYTTVCSAAALDEFCSLLLSARFGSADVLLDVIGRVQLDAYVNDEQVRTCKTPSDQGDSETCYAHATAAVLHMALLRIVGREGGCPSIEEIRKEILAKFPSEDGGRVVKEVLEGAIGWYRPLKSRKTDEEGARQAVLHRRPVLTTFRLSHSGWNTFSQHFEDAATRSSVLTRARMEQHRLLPDDGGHAVVLSKCDPRSLTFLNSWGHDWGNGGSFSVEDHTVLELDGASEATRVCFYDVYWLEEDLTAAERQAYNVKVDEALACAQQHRSILELEARCPRCCNNAPIAKFTGSIRQAVCPLCHQSFAPEPGHLVQALYARAGLSYAA
jgi:hypothetical protein